MTEVLLVQLAGVVDIWLWCVLEDLTKGQPSILLIVIFTSIPFYQTLMLSSQRLLDIIIDSLPLLFRQKPSKATPICLSLIISSFLPDISRFSLIRSSTFISASSSGSRGRSRLGRPLEEDLEPSFLTVSVCRLRWKKVLIEEIEIMGLLGFG